MPKTLIRTALPISFFTAVFAVLLMSQSLSTQKADLNSTSISTPCTHSGSVTTCDT